MEQGKVSLKMSFEQMDSVNALFQKVALIKGTPPFPAFIKCIAT